MSYKMLSVVLGLPKTLYFNMKYLKFRDAIKLPIIVSHNLLLAKVRGELVIESPISFGMIRIGFNDVGIFDKYKRRSIWRVNGKIIFKGNASLGHGSKISVGNNGELIIGNDFVVSAESSIVCEKRIRFGDRCLISWENLIMDTDFHTIFDDKGKVINIDRDILIGNNVWIGCRNTILKGVNITNNVVIGAGNIITKDILTENIVVSGEKLDIIQRGISWE